MRITIICCLLMLTVTRAHAQETTPEPASGWTIEQRCVGEPTTPPDDWTFEGAIFLQSDDGIHALRADVETPYFISFAGRDFITAGAISPDGTMFAVPSGDVEYGNMVHNVFIVEEIRVYSTAPSNELLATFPIHYSEYSDSEEIGVSDVIWLDNEHFVYYGTLRWGEIDSTTDYFIFDITNNEITPRLVPTAIDPLFTIPSPDETRGIRPEHDPTTYTAEWTLYDIVTGEGIALLPSSSQTANIWWHPNSSLFITYFHSENAQTLIFDRDGNFQEILYHTGLGNLIWSSDGELFTFISGREPLLYIGNMQQRQIIATCLAVWRGAAWFFSNDEIAFAYDRKITVLDLESWLAYITAYHHSGVIGWRADA